MFSELWKQKSELCFGLLSLIAGCIRGKEKWGGHSQNDTLSLCLMSHLPKDIKGVWEKKASPWRAAPNQLIPLSTFPNSFASGFHR